MKQQKVEKMNNQVILYELDNQNKDSANFENSQIESIQIQVDFDKQLNNTVRDLFLRQKMYLLIQERYCLIIGEVT